MAVLPAVACRALIRSRHAYSKTRTTLILSIKIK